MKTEQINQEFGSILIIVPHQDDEILMSAGVIYEAVAHNVAVQVVIVTNGDYGCSNFTVGETRLKETLKGTKLLGLSEENVWFLGYADTGMPAKESFLTHLYEEKDANKIYPSLCGQKTYGLKEKEDYHFQKHGEHASYCRYELKQDLSDMIMEIRPQNIITTSRFDEHGDHAALSKLLVEILKEKKETSGYQVNLYEGLIHSNAGDDHWPLRGTETYSCPDQLEEVTSLIWEDRISIPVPECMRVCKGQKSLKYQALQQYKTALEPNAVDFLISFVKDEEIFWKLTY